MQPRTPGVYINEPDSFPPSIVGVDTAVPAFIGYTEKAAENRKNLHGLPQRISSMADFERCFGAGPSHGYAVVDAAAPPAPGEREIGTLQMEGRAAESRLVDRSPGRFILYDSLRLFYSNGGGDCYIVSCGSYGGEKVDKGALLEGLAAIENVVGPTMLVIPDAALLGAPGASDVASAMLQQCLQSQDRVAIMDVSGAEVLPPGGDFGPLIARFRDGLAGAPAESLRYGMAYFPFLQTCIVDPAEFSPADFDMGPGAPPLSAGSADFARLAAMAAADRGLLPPSGAMAGVYASNDADRGVWNAPANVGIADLLAPTIEINGQQQQDLNAPAEGLAVNAIRTFVNRGSLVWGARTLDGNSNDWRYIQVRRTMIYVQQSVKTALNSFVFAPNTAQTWVTVTSMAESFLHGLWAEGGLMGASPSQAFRVQCGLGSTMTADDVMNGIMRVQLVLTMVHPAEFIELTFEQQMLGGS
jgi:phage tail sheath protein FI